MSDLNPTTYHSVLTFLNFGFPCGSGPLSWLAGHSAQRIRDAKSCGAWNRWSSKILGKLEARVLLSASPASCFLYLRVVRPHRNNGIDTPNPPHPLQPPPLLSEMQVSLHAITSRQLRAVYSNKTPHVYSGEAGDTGAPTRLSTGKDRTIGQRSKAGIYGVS